MHPRDRRSRRILAIAVVLAAALGGGRRAAGDDDPAALVEALGGDDVAARYPAYRALLAKHPPEALPLLARRVLTMPVAAQTYGVSLVIGYPAAAAKPVFERWLAADGPGAAYPRIVAACQLTRQGDGKATAVLAAVLADPATPAEALSYGLPYAGSVRDPKVLAAVRGRVRPGAPLAVLGAALSMLLSADDRATVAPAEALLADAAAAPRALGAAFLWRLGDEGRAEALAAAVAAPDFTYEAFLRVNALLAAAPRLPENVLEALLARLDPPAAGWSLPVLIEPLGRAAWPKAAPALRRLLEDPSAPVSKAAFEALTKIPGGLTVETVRDLLAGGDEARRVAAAEALRRADDPAGFATVLEVLRRGTSARAEAARVLGGFRRREAVEPLLDALLDADAAVRDAAEASLQQTLTTLFPYRRLSVAATGYRASSGPDANRAAVERLRGWWATAKASDW